VRHKSDFHSPLLSWIAGVVIIWYYKRLSRKLRKKAGLPELYDNNDLPDPIFDPNYVHVLTDKQQYELHHRTSFLSPVHRGAASFTFYVSTEQKKFMKSQTWYRPHGTETHRVSDFTIDIVIVYLILMLIHRRFQSSAFPH
jgi:hypothetical protein